MTEYIPWTTAWQEAQLYGELQVTVKVHRVLGCTRPAAGENYSVSVAGDLGCVSRITFVFGDDGVYGEQSREEDGSIACDANEKSHISLALSKEVELT